MGWLEKAQTLLLTPDGVDDWAIQGLPPTLLTTACHLTSPQPPGSLEGGASECAQGGSG